MDLLDSYVSFSWNMGLKKKGKKEGKKGHLIATIMSAIGFLTTFSFEES
jgi:hypothetical protein